MALRILALLTDGFAGHGGIARYNRDFLRALAKAEGGPEIIALTRSTLRPTDDLPAGIEEIPAGHGRLQYSANAFRVALTRGPFDLIFCGHLFMTPLAAALSTLLRVPFWLQLHGVDAWERPRGLSGRLAGRARLVTAVSRYTRARFLEWADCDPSTVRILPNTFDPKFAPGPKPLSLVERHALSGRKVLLTVARLSAVERYKGHDRIIAAMPAILRHEPSAVYLIVGDGDDRPRLEALARETGLTDRVIFAGNVPQQELADYYRLADAFAMPSTGEGFGIVFLEAAAAGLPVVGGNRDGSVDALADGEIGTLVDPLDEEALAAALLAALRQGRGTPRGLGRFSTPAFETHVAALLRSLDLERSAGTNGQSRQRLEPLPR